MDRKRFDRLMKRLSTGELAEAERRELHELAAGDRALRAQVAQTEAILTAAHESRVEQPSEFEWAAFSTRLRATIEAAQPRPYGRFRLWLGSLAGEFRTRRPAVAVATAAAVGIAVLLVVIGVGPGTKPSTPLLVENPQPTWQLDDFEQHYELADVLPDAKLLAIQVQFDTELDAVHKVIETEPVDGAGSEDGSDDVPGGGTGDEVLDEILGQEA